MLAHITDRAPERTYAVVIERRDLVLAMEPHPGHHVIDNADARIIASWYHSPGPCCQHITLLSHGLPFDTAELRQEIHEEIEPIDTRDAAALRHWLNDVEAQRMLTGTWCDCDPFGHRRGCPRRPGA